MYLSSLFDQIGHEHGARVKSTRATTQELRLIGVGAIVMIGAAFLSHLSPFRFGIAAFIGAVAGLVAWQAAKTYGTRRPRAVALVVAGVVFAISMGSALPSLVLVVSIAGAFAAAAVHRYPEGLCASALRLRSETETGSDTNADKASVD